MKRNVLTLVILAVAFSFLAVSCGEKPEYEMRKAERMVRYAKTKKSAGQLNSKGLRHLKKAEKALREGKADMDGAQYAGARDNFLRAWREADRAARNILTEKPKPEVKMDLPIYKHHCVSKGESLWWIASYEDYYGDPFSWPLIYAENKCTIDWEAKRRGMPKMQVDGYAHWIFPGQVLRINMTPDIEDWIWARDLAGAPCPCDLPLDCGQAVPVVPEDLVDDYKEILE